ncbi:unnamed protein product [Effrenium voratum]|nr:unnamed protein product [Effrenium voratum]
MPPSEKFSPGLFERLRARRAAVSSDGAGIFGLFRDALLALGLLSAAPRSDSQAAPRKSGGCHSHPAQENEEVDETVEVRRVLPEEEERRYWANMAGAFGLDESAGHGEEGHGQGEEGTRKRLDVAYEL